MKYSKFIIVLVILLICGFTAWVLIDFKEVGSEPTTLIASFFAFMGTEVLSLATITIKKEAKKKKKEVEEE